VIEEVEDAAVAEEEAVAAAAVDSKDTKIRDPQRAFSNSDMFLTLARMISWSSAQTRRSHISTRQSTSKTKRKSAKLTRSSDPSQTFTSL